MTALNPTLCARLAAEALEDHERMTPAPWIAEHDTLYHDSIEDGTIELATFGGDATVDEDAAIARQRNNLAETAEQLDAAAKVGDVVRRMHESSQDPRLGLATPMRLVRKDVLDELLALIGDRQ